MQTFKALCKSTYDPCYGHKIIKQGQELTITLSQVQGSPDWRIVETSNGDCWPGFGMRISEYELENHFTLNKGDES